MKDFVDMLPDEAVEGEIVPSAKALIDRPLNGHTMLRDVAAEIVDGVTRVSKDILHFADIEPTDEAPPEEWVAELGHADAMRRLRTAKYALMSPKEAPVALKIIAQFGGNIIKAKAAERNVTNELHIERVYLTAPVPTYPELEIESDE